MEIIIETEGQRLDKAIRESCKDISRTRLQKLIEDGKIQVNGKIEKNSYTVKVNDRIIIEEEQAQEVDIKPQEIPLDVIYEDQDIIVINKQKGLVVHPGNGNPDNTLVNGIMSKCKGSLSGIGGKIRPGIVHRLDKDTSGLIIVAKNDIAHIELSEQMKKHEIKKTYIALVRGVIEENEATIKMPIARSTKNRIKMAVSKNGKEAITHFKVLKRYEKYTLLELNIETGRTHQIRVHMTEIGHPVVGDMIYSNGKNEFNIEGQMLHAKKLEFLHPINKNQIKLEAPLPQYFENILHVLDK